VKVILKETISGMGGVGEIINVAPGYARNFLLPRDLAALATEKNMSQLAHEKKLIALRQAKQYKEANELATQLKGQSVTIKRQVAGEDEEKIFGSVTTRDIAEALRQNNFKINRRQIRFDENVKTLGTYEFSVKLHNDVEVPLKVWVVKE